jgi:hypothetical protein
MTNLMRNTELATLIGIEGVHLNNGAPILQDEPRIAVEKAFSNQINIKFLQMLWRRKRGMAMFKQRREILRCL